jgi:uncharacterized membrane protein (UPF0127 family)
MRISGIMSACGPVLRVLVTGFVLVTGATAALAEGPPPLEPISIATPDHATIFTAEVADTPELRSKGLMFRHRLPDDQAMLFDFGTPKPASMWMKNTYISLDMLFVRQNGTIAAIAENTEPMSEQIISVDEAVRAVVELPAGTAKRLHLERGDHVYHRIFTDDETSQ